MARVYLSGDQIDEAREAIRTGTSPLHVAWQLGVTVEELQSLLGNPQWKQVPAARIAGESDRIDLWAAEDRL